MQIYTFQVTDTRSDADGGWENGLLLQLQLLLQNYLRSNRQLAVKKPAATNRHQTMNRFVDEEMGRVAADLLRISNYRGIPGDTVRADLRLPGRWGRRHFAGSPVLCLSSRQCLTAFGLCTFPFYFCFCFLKNDSVNVERKQT
jgi:hypothetical protein